MYCNKLYFFSSIFQIKINDTDIICKLLEGEEEESYFVKVQEDMSNHRNKRRDGGKLFKT